MGGKSRMYLVFGLFVVSILALVLTLARIAQKGQWGTEQIALPILFLISAGTFGSQTWTEWRRQRRDRSQ